MNVCRLMSVAGFSLMVFCAVGVFNSSRADAPESNPNVRNRARSDMMRLAQIATQAHTQAQSACYSLCDKRCDADYKTCSMNGKAPQLLINQTCGPHASECRNKCTASCYK